MEKLDIHCTPEKSTSRLASLWKQIQRAHPQIDMRNKFGDFDSDSCSRLLSVCRVCQQNSHRDYVVFPLSVIGNHTDASCLNVCMLALISCGSKFHFVSTVWKLQTQIGKLNLSSDCASWIRLETSVWISKKSWFLKNSWKNREKIVALRSNI